MYLNLSSSDGEHSWDAKLGASVGLYRFEGLWSIDLGSEIELVATPDNDIHFQPRVFYWQESLFAMRRDGSLDWGLGYYHRCRHDVDNIAEENAFAQVLERVCIWDSLSLRAYPRPLEWSWMGGLSGSARLTLDEHYYVLLQDSVPGQYAGRSVSLEDLVDTLAVGLVAEPLRWKAAAWYLAVKEYTDFYRASGGASVSADVLAETGVALRGRGSSLEAFARYERFAETLVDPWRQAGEYLTLGLRAN